MTKEQAVKILRQGSKMAWDAEEFCEAYDMAIKALEQPTSDDCVSRQAVVEYIKACGAELGHDCENEIVVEDIQALPPVTPTHCIAEVKFSKEDLREICKERIEIECTHGTCKDCKHWKDSDGVYRRGVDAESKCPINTKEVYEGNFYCKDFKKRGDSDDSY